MKESLLLLSFSSLLVASSGILSQPTDKINASLSSITLTTQDETFISASNSDTNTKDSALILANITGIEKTQLNNLSTIERLVTDHARADEHQANHDITRQELAIKELASQLPQLSEEELAHMRELFLQAEAAVKKKDEANYIILGNQLKEYPLYPYLQYQWLSKKLDQEEAIKHFLQTHGSSRYANKLKRKWLIHLGKKKQWPLIIDNRLMTSNATLNCYYHRAQFNTGNKRAALYGARDLWAVGHSQPRVCDPLFSELRKSDLYTQELLWQRFAAALKNNKVSLASYVKNQMAKEHHATAQLWLNLHRNPSRYMPKLLSQPENELTASMFIHAVNRLASRDVTAAIEIWDANNQRYNTDENNVDRLAKDKLERRLALKLAFARDDAAYERFSQLEGHNSDSRTWRVRVALSEQNWKNVHDAIHALSEEEQQEEKWQYWLARAHLETGKTNEAQSMLSELSKNRSFYGYLAADKVNSLYQLSHNPVDVSEIEIEQLSDRKEFRVAHELMMLDKKNEAKLQWWHASKNLNKKEILVAAKLAQQWQWDEIAIFTIAKAKYWDDIDVRFPLSYTDKIHENSEQHNLNPVIVYGLIRRESAFNEKATSPTGARGLMQIMPKTGRYIARKLNERWRGKNSLYNPVTNIKYGSYYYQKLLTQFDGHYALALAAYNAGPHRVKKWLPEDKTMPADIWIETIPYKETREYVTSVLAYALIYQQRTQLNEQEANNLSMNDFTREITPLDSGS